MSELTSVQDLISVVVRHIALPSSSELIPCPSVFCCLNAALSCQLDARQKWDHWNSLHALNLLLKLLRQFRKLGALIYPSLRPARARA
jgi:hypothetical protein